jgi:uncharacterized protein YkuJ
MGMQHGDGLAACTGTCSIDTNVDIRHLLSMRHVNVCPVRPRLWCMFKFILLVQIHAACPCQSCNCLSMSLLYVHVIPHVHFHAAWPCPSCMSMSMLLVHVHAEHGHGHRRGHWLAMNTCTGTWYGQEHQNFAKNVLLNVVVVCRAQYRNEKKLFDLKLPKSEKSFVFEKAIDFEARLKNSIEKNYKNKRTVWFRDSYWNRNETK